MLKKAVIVDLKLNNIKSLTRALTNVGFDCHIGLQDDFIKKSDVLFLPGVGSYSAAMKYIKKNQIDRKIFQHIKRKKKLVGICLGMQLLFEESSEFKKTKGLGIFKGKVVSLKKKINTLNYPVPNIGWNTVNIKNKNSLFFNIKKKDFYFVHSYYAEPKDKNIISSYLNLDNKKICSSISRNNINAFQFHPEKSGSEGIRLLKNLYKYI